MSPLPQLLITDYRHPTTKEEKMRDKSSQFSGKHKVNGSWVKDLSSAVGREIYERFIVCKTPEIRNTKKGDTCFLSVEVGDKTGSIELKVWQIPIPEADKVLTWFEQGKIYAIEAAVREYRDKTQLNMTWERDHANRPWICDVTDYFEEDFNMIAEWPFSFSIETLAGRINELILGMKHPGYREILQAFWNDDDWRKRFKKWPAAKRRHHAYIGGLLHHVYEMLEIGLGYSALGYDKLNVDLLVAGIILHDIGKLEEYKLGLQIEYDEDVGQIGHTVRTIELIDRAVWENKIEISETDLRALKHLILSHHGDVELGYGSAVSPQTPEARLMHCLDMTSAKTNEEYFKKHKI